MTNVELLTALHAYRGYCRELILELLDLCKDHEHHAEQLEEIDREIEKWRVA